MTCSLPNLTFYIASVVVLGLVVCQLRRLRKRLNGLVEKKASERFTELVEHYDEADRAAMETAVQIRHMTEEEFRLVAKSTQCVLWHADVEDPGGDQLNWDLRVFADELGDFVSMQDVPPDYRVGAWYYGRAEDDMFRLARNATAAIRSDAPGYRQEFRCMAKDGTAVWFQEDTRILKIGPSKYRLFGVSMDITDRKRSEEQREKLLAELQRALADVKQLQGMLPICAWCKKIRNDDGYWSQIEEYMHQHANVQFSHGLCPDCARKLYPDISLDETDEKPGKSPPAS